jgi:hypothetical protein
MALAAYHGAALALSVLVLWHPDLELASLDGEPSAGRPYGDVLVVAKKLEPIAVKIAQGLPFAMVRDVRRVERELVVSDGGAGVVADTSSTGGLAVPSSGMDPPLQK